MKKIVIAQYWTSNIAYGKYTKLINQRYCDLKGYEYYCETDDDKIKAIVEHRAYTWYKPKFLLEVLERTNADYVLFLDADAIVVNDSYQIEDFIDQDRHIICTEDHGPSKMNAGVILIDNSDYSKQFLQQWWDTGDSLKGGDANNPGYYANALWHDQTGFSHLLEHDLDAQRNIKVVTNTVLNARVFNNEQNNFIFHAFSYGELKFRTIDECYYRIFYPNKTLIAVVYHCYLVNKWQQQINEQLSRLESSGLYDAADFIHLTINCSPDQIQEFTELVQKFSKLELHFYQENHYEYPAIKLIKEFSYRISSNLKVLYFHTKGISNQYRVAYQNTTDGLNFSEEKYQNQMGWRDHLEYCLIDQWKFCIEKLDHYDIVGGTCNGQWESGNFYWTNIAHVSRCEHVGIWGRWGYEWWLNNTDPKPNNYAIYRYGFIPSLTNMQKEWYTDPNCFKDVKLILKAAYYGTGNFQLDEGYSNTTLGIVSDVTDTVARYLEDHDYNLLDIPVNNITFGHDPIHGQRKILVVEMALSSAPDRVFKIGQNENSQLVFPTVLFDIS